MNSRTFQTPGPVTLHVEIGSGEVSVTATDTDQTQVEVEGKDADKVVITHEGRTISVTVPRGGFLFGGHSKVQVRAQIPSGSDLSTVLGSADLDVTGIVDDCSVKSGSGHVRLDQLGSADLTSGSGGISVQTVRGDLRARSGSGEVSVQSLGQSADVTTGSGDITLGQAAGPVSVKSGSGTVSLGSVTADVTVTAASGDVRIEQAQQGTVSVRTASGDIAAGAAAGVPVWTDFNTVSGSIASALQPLGKPADGQAFLELRLRTVSGDIVVRHNEPAHS